MKNVQNVPVCFVDKFLSSEYTLIMLTQNDLEQIRKVIKEEVKPLDKKLDQVQEDISEILISLDQRHTKLETRVDRLETEVGIATS
jgi:3-phenylpropionate/cinnamic acid dioxygenase small subunit